VLPRLLWTLPGGVRSEKAWWRSLREGLTGTSRSSRSQDRSPGRWVHGLAAALLVLVILLAWLKLGWMPGSIGRRGRHVAESRERMRNVDITFFQRLEKLLHGYGLDRRHSQTAREFAEQAGAAIAQQTGHQRVTTWILLVTEAYYGVRFGRLTLDDDQAVAVAQATRQIEQVLKGASQR
jgi:hypothetical protein